MSTLKETLESRREELEGLVYDRNTKTWKTQFEWACDNNCDKLTRSIEKVIDKERMEINNIIYEYTEELKDRGIQFHFDQTEYYESCYKITIKHPDGNRASRQYTFKRSELERYDEMDKLFISCVRSSNGFECLSYKDVLSEIENSHINGSYTKDELEDMVYARVR